MEQNYDRLVIEINNLKRRVADLERANFTLQRKYYQLWSDMKQREIKDYFDNYKPKNEQ